MHSWVSVYLSRRDILLKLQYGRIVLSSVIIVMFLFFICSRCAKSDEKVLSHWYYSRIRLSDKLKAYSG